GAPRFKRLSAQVFQLPSRKCESMVTRVSRFDLDWWVVQKKLIYVLVILLSLCVVAGGAGLYVWLYGNPSKGAPAAAGSSAGARFVSFEGGGRVVRAKTRATLH